MTSLLPVCLALLLPACVLGQLPLHYTYMTMKCQGDAGHSFDKCVKKLSQDALSSQSTCREDLNAVMKCLGDLFRGCLPQEYQGLVLTDAMATDMVSYECGHFTEITSCVSKAQISGCGRRNTEDDFVNGTCTYLHEFRECLVDSTSCTGSVASVFNTYYQKTIPPACGGGSTGVPLVPTPLLIPAACALVLLKMAAIL